MSAVPAAMRASTDAVLASAAELNKLDAQAGDGDLGVTMTHAANVVAGLLPELEGEPPADILRACGAALARETPSTSGTLLATGLLRAAKAAADGVGDGAVAELLGAARDGIAERGGAEPGSKTILDALDPAARAAGEAASADAGPAKQLEAAAAAAERGAQATREMTPRHGRAGWLAERSAGHEDAGARLIAIILSGAERSLASTSGR